jgi:cytosine/adenosine deaminase-related metal-dependent hydrolase
MQRYYFSIDDGLVPFHDRVGEVFSNEDEIRAAAMRTAGEMLRDGVAPAFWSGAPWKLSVKDAQHRVVLSVTLRATQPHDAHAPEVISFPAARGRS